MLAKGKSDYKVSDKLTTELSRYFDEYRRSVPKAKNTIPDLRLTQGLAEKYGPKFIAIIKQAASIEQSIDLVIQTYDTLKAKLMTFDDDFLSQLANFAWGFQGDNEQQPKRIQIFNELMGTIAKRKSPTKLSTICIALQFLVMFRYQYSFSDYHKNAMKVVSLADVNLLGNALTNIYCLLTTEQDADLFIDLLKKIKNSFLDEQEVDAVFSVFLIRYTPKPIVNPTVCEQSVAVVPAKDNSWWENINNDLQNYIPKKEQAGLTFEMNIGWILKICDVEYAFNIETSTDLDDEVFLEQGRMNTLYVSQDNSDQVRKFIALRMFAIIMSLKYQQTYHDLLGLSYSDFTGSQKPFVDDNYQAAYDTMFEYINIKNTIDENDLVLVNAQDRSNALEFQFIFLKVANKHLSTLLDEAPFYTLVKNSSIHKQIETIINYTQAICKTIAAPASQHNSCGLYHLWKSPSVVPHLEQDDSASWYLKFN